VAFLKFSLNIGKGMIYRAFVASALRKSFLFSSSSSSSSFFFFFCIACTKDASIATHLKFSGAVI
jgi:hypothetical protein